MTDEKQIVIPAKLGQDIANYLAQRPYSEVFRFIAGLVNAPTVTTAPAPAPIPAKIEG